jgi:hypothetical protein
VRAAPRNARGAMGDAARPGSGVVVPAGARGAQHHAFGVGAADAAHYYESDDEAVWHDALSCFDDDEAAAALAAYAAAEARSAAGAAPAHSAAPELLLPPGSAPLPCDPLDADDWLPPNNVPPAARAAAVDALRARILATPDAGARAWPPPRRHTHPLSLCLFLCLPAVHAAAPLPARAPDAVAHWEDRSPATLERFLRARDYDVPIAAALLLEHRAWRQGFGWAIGFEQLPPKLIGHAAIALQALSRRGNPLLIIVTRRHDKCVGSSSPLLPCVLAP